MQLFPTDIIQINQQKLDEINKIVKSIYRLIIYSRYHLDDDLLDVYLEGMQNLRDLVGIKNAQMEAQNEEEAIEYFENLKKSLDFVVEEIVLDNNFNKEIQLFQLLRLISPETNKIHPNSYRKTIVQVGGHICPEPNLVSTLVSELFYKLEHIKTPIIKAIYFHHELIRIHPFVDGNGRVTRIAKNWILMYDLYPPIFINDTDQKKEYISTLGNSFNALTKDPNQWNEYTARFFEQELDRLLTNAKWLFKKINQIGKNREQQNEIPFNQI
ncbi:Fic family protein [Flavobacterium sp.]|uniref:Fic family protein n=1 Tax=Flavobacterium sp. TaxID=239 RepID=UPI00286E66BF|nr:Fic family protein [Flavobacterium sp.]